MVGLFLWGLETYYVFTDPEGLRLGDRWADTRFVNVRG